MTEPGTKVLAIRNTDPETKKAYVFGYGVYEGKFPRPGTPKEMPEKDADMIRQIVVRGDKPESLEENRSWIRKKLAGEVADDKMTQDEADRQYMEYLDKEKAHHGRPVEDRVQEVWLMMQGNPRIKLDDGGYCWGFECWWGPVDRMEKEIDGLEQVKVKPEFGDAH